VPSGTPPFRNKETIVREPSVRRRSDVLVRHTTPSDSGMLTRALTAAACLALFLAILLSPLPANGQAAAGPASASQANDPDQGVDPDVPDFLRDVLDDTDYIRMRSEHIALLRGYEPG
jgi:hypothetical protein